jgi:dephospho-CoA kinase
MLNLLLDGNKMLKIGITGGIGSGKSTVCKLFDLLGIPIYYTDDEAKKILYFDSAVNKRVVETFGVGVLDANQLIDKVKLAKEVFADATKLAQLNAIIHPAVAQHFEQWLMQHADAPYILKEAAILFESGAYKAVDKIISIVAPEHLKISRATQRDRSTVELVKQRMSHQLGDEERVQRSDFVIHNDGNQLLIPQVLIIHEKLSKNI